MEKNTKQERERKKKETKCTLAFTTKQTHLDSKTGMNFIFQKIQSEGNIRGE